MPRRGREIWKFDPSGGAPSGARFRHRGVTVHDDRVFVTYRNWLWALDRKTGTPIASFGVEGRVDLREGLGMPPDRASVSASTPGAIFEDMLIMGSSVPGNAAGTPGHIRAFDVHTGKLRWIFHTIPQPGEFAYDTLAAGRPQPDRRRQRVGRRHRRHRERAWSSPPPAPPRSTSTASIVTATTCSRTASLALDARTGKRVWHFQGIRHDVWDWDFPTAPNLVTVRRNGRLVEAVAQVTKFGYVYVLDRRTGASLFPLANRKVPPSEIEGEKLAESQPYPLKPPPFTRQGLTAAMLTTRTPEAHAAVLSRFKQLGSGMFAPPTERGIIVFPGFDGGAEWGGAAFDPRERAALRELERDAVDRAADPEQRHVALQGELRELPPRGPERLPGGAVARTHRRAPDARTDRDGHSRGHRTHARFPGHGRRATSRTSWSS